MRLLAVSALALLFAATAARAATLDVQPQTFSPRAGRLVISATIESPKRLGVQVATVSGKLLGWIARPLRRRAIEVGWNGRLGGRPLRDGWYRIRLVASGRQVATAPFRLDTTAPLLSGLAASNGGAPFAGDGPLLTTISPNGDGFRDRAVIRFRLAEAGTVTLTAETTNTSPHPIYHEQAWFAAGRHSLVWAPEPTVTPRTYLIRLATEDEAGNRLAYGPANQLQAQRRQTPVVRVQGVDAGFTRDSYAPGEIAELAIATDAPSLTLQLFRSGPERVVTKRDDTMSGVPAGDSLGLGWGAWRDAPHRVRLMIPALATGFYYAFLTAPDGRVGYAPFVVRPPLLGEHRVAVVLPTSTWQAYNFRDENGDGFGDTWYAGASNETVRLGRPFLNRGVPPHFRLYDLAFVRWLANTKHDVDYLSDSDLELFQDGDGLARLYDLIVFPGHEEYVTEHAYDVVERYRDLGGNLAFLSADNFFWKVERDGDTLRRVQWWRKLGRPEAGLIGVQYRGNDSGQRQAPYVVVNAEAAPWLFDRTGLVDGAPFGYYGIEIDGTGPSSPPGTTVLAEISDLFGPGFSAQMTYYETPAGAKVFAAGALTFGGSVMVWPQRRLLQNLWNRLSVP